MKKTIRRWISLLLSVLLVLSVAAGTAEEPDDAQRWYDLAMEAYQAGDFETTLEDFRKSADLGNGEALNWLGVMYIYGLGVEPSDEKAIEYVLRGVELGDIGTPGIPGGSLALMAMVFASAGIPVECVAVAAGIDRIIDMGRTVMSITGDASCAVVMQRILGKKLQ